MSVCWVQLKDQNEQQSSAERARVSVLQLADEKEKEAEAVNAIRHVKDGEPLPKQRHLENSIYDGDNRMNIENLVLKNATRKSRHRVGQSTRKAVKKLKP